MRIKTIGTSFLLGLVCVQISAAPEANRQQGSLQAPKNDSSKVIGDADRTDEDYFSNYRYGSPKNIQVPDMYLDKDGNPETPGYYGNTQEESEF